MHRCPMIIVFEPLVHPGPHSVRSCFSHVQALGFRDGRFQLSLSFRRCSAQHVLVDGPAGLWIVSGSVPAFPSAIFSFSDVAFAVGPFLCHGIRLLCNDKCHGKIARAYGHSYQMVRKELPATALSLCIAYQSLTWELIFALSVARFPSSSIFIFLAARLSAPSSKQYSPAIPVPRWNPAMKDVREIPPPSSFSRFASCNRVSRSGRCKYSLISL